MKINRPSKKELQDLKNRSDEVVKLFESNEYFRETVVLHRLFSVACELLIEFIDREEKEIAIAKLRISPILED